MRETEELIPFSLYRVLPPLPRQDQVGFGVLVASLTEKGGTVGSRQTSEHSIAVLPFSGTLSVAFPA